MAIFHSFLLVHQKVSAVSHGIPNGIQPGTLLMGPVSGVALGAAALYVAWTNALRSFQIWQDGHGSKWLKMDEYWWLLNVDEYIDKCWWILINVDEYWWILMNIDEYWWILMNIDEYSPNLTNIEYISFRSSPFWKITFFSFVLHISSGRNSWRLHGLSGAKSWHGVAWLDGKMTVT